jgi:GTP-binding protein EngB required for normal cell division
MMKMTETDVHGLADWLKERLPQHLHEKVAKLAEARSPSGSALHLIVLGSFSVGKSTLLNMLIGEQYLHVAKEEATSLPTFIEHGTEPCMAVVGSDGSVLPVDVEGFRDATSCAPEGAAYATLALPLPWLQGVTLVDLPGLGSVSEARQQYTAAQVLQADAVLYLLDPRGPAPADIDTLRLASQYGKRIKIVVGRWDEVLDAQARGEPMPRLEAWSAQIEERAGLRLRLAGVNRDGIGREDVLEFVSRARSELDAIRLQRFKAELKPLLRNALGLNEDAQKVCAADSEQTVGAMHAEMIQRKQQLLDLKAELYERQQHDKVAVTEAAGQATAMHRQALEPRLAVLAGAVAEEADWERLQAEGCQLLRGALAELAGALSAHSGRYGELALPEGQADRLHLHLPPMAPVDVSALVDTARLAALERAILEKQREMAQSEQRLETLPVTSLDAAEDALREKLRQRIAIASEPLARITEVVPGNGAAEIGRILGEIGDIALMFVEPVSAGTKVASLVGKGASVAKASVDVAKVAKTVETGVKAAQAAKGLPGKALPSPVLDKIGMLQAMSLGYWGERIGMLMGGAPSERQIVDPAARAAQEKALAVIDHDIQQARRDLERRQDLLSERQLSGWALEQSKRDLVRLEQEIAALASQREQRAREAQQDAHEERVRVLQRHAARAVQGWMVSYDQQAATMAQLLAARVAAHWEGEVEAAVGERARAVDDLLERLHAEPAAREAQLAGLRDEARALGSCIEELA